MSNPAANNDVTLTIGGAVYSGWTEIEVATGIDAVAASFSLGLSERAPGGEPWAITAGGAASVAIGGETLVTGWLDRLDSHLDGDSRSITASGRSKAGDLVDCSALNAPGSWANQSIESIASAIAAPFGISVSVEADTGAPLPRFALQSGESAWEAIERMLKQRGLLGISGSDGNIRIVSPKPGPASLVITQGREPIAIEVSHDVSDRFGRYIAKGQAAGDDHASGAVVASPRAEALDAAVTRYRPLIVIAEDQATPASLAARAQWEASVRAAKAQTARVTIPGWRQPGGMLWAPMQLVRLVAPAGWIDASLMLVGVTFRLGEQGRHVELMLGRPEAYTQLPVAADAKPSAIFKQRDASKLRVR